MSTRLRYRFDAAQRSGQVLWWVDGRFVPRRPADSPQGLSPAAYVVAAVEAGQLGHVELFAWAERHPEIQAGHALDDVLDLVDEVRGVPPVKLPANDGESLLLDQALLEQVVAGWKEREP